jgi:subtilase family serine protease
LSVTPPSGTGAAAVQYTATTPNTTTAARTGTLVIAGISFPVTQAAPADLVPRFASVEGVPSYCNVNTTTKTDNATVQVTNAGNGDDVVSSVTRISLTGTPPPDQPTGPIAAGAQASVSFVLPMDCYTNGNGVCSFQIDVDATNTVVESNESNNTIKGSCGSHPPSIGAGRLKQ